MSAATLTEHAPVLRGLDVALAAMLRGEQADWQDAWSAEEKAAIERIRYHGIALALIEIGHDFSSWPAEVIEAIRDEARLQVLWEESHRDVLVPVLQRLAAEQIHCIVMKGTATAYLLHDTPAARRRGDSDVLIQPQQLDSVRALLEELDWTRHEIDYFGQESWLFDTGMGFVHAIDLHWRSVGTPFLAQVFGEVILFKNQIPLPRLCDAARTLSPPLLLLRAVMNQRLHDLSGYIQDYARVFADDRLIWLLDIALLMQRFSDADWADLVAAAERREMGAMCLDQLKKVDAFFDAPLPDDVASRLARKSDVTGVESYFALGSAGARLWRDLGSLDGFVPRLGHLQRHLFPSKDALEKRFPEAVHWPAPLLYARRFASGVRNVFAGRGQ
ncbi:nucleotidyltransferase family protein [Aurantiacibacter sediminis]|uniref:Nucleotidyltransferase family protein n=1 Tax=Aurantiacibacter sediminis TaxID=2793064 RepID=A0ABS0MZV2_9SPHN|nr:nucleotidyltransferase family protein [Aurantiacibacter sediminis]MBH5321242.1 nucleotidyltransferase family protein [Aurantiacibacter sediminis]